jgi:hypothetical protein
MGKNPGFYDALYSLGLIDRIPLSEEESASMRELAPSDLPEDVYYTLRYINESDKPKNRVFFRYGRIDESEMLVKLAVKQAADIHEIKRYVNHIFIVALLALLGGIIAALAVLL